MKNFFYFTRGERRGIFVLLLILSILIGVNYYFVNKIRNSRAKILLDEKYDSLIDSLTLLDSIKQAERIEIYRSNQAKCTQEVISNRVIVEEELTQVVTVKLELNTADSLQLVGLKGIGPTYAHRIVAYRDLLGGYYSVDQLLEIRGMTQENFDRIQTQVCVNATKIKRFNLNTITYDELKNHPYLTAKQAYYLVKQRNLDYPWKGVDEIQTDEEILTKKGLKKIEPYLFFK